MLARPTTPELTEDALIGWLKTQNPDTPYSFQDPVLCLMGHYFRAHDTYPAEVSFEQMPNYRAIAEAKPHTFGAALARAEAIKALPAPTPQIEAHVSRPALTVAATV